MDALFHDLRFAFRSFKKKPALTAVVLLTIAIGIGGSTAIFSVLHGIVLSPLPYPEADRIVQVWPARASGMSKQMLEALQAHATSYEALAGWSENDFKMLAGDRSELLFGPQVTADFFRVLGARPALGRLFQEGDDRNGPLHVVLSYEQWQSRFGGDPEILGRVIEGEGEQYTVIGIAPRGFDALAKDFDVAIPHLVEQGAVDYDANYLDIIGRLKPGVTPEEADAELRTLAYGWAEEAGVSPDWAETASVVTLHEYLVGDVRPTLLLLLGAVGFILLIVVANVANLLLARILSREQEISVRAALGASRRRLAGQLLTETMMLAVLGGALGAALAGISLKGLVALLPPDVPRLESISVNPQVLGFALLLALVTGLLVGLVPAMTASKTDLREGLSSTRSSTSSRSRRRLRSALVVVEVTLAMALLVGAGVVMKSFWRTLQVDPGFQPEGLVRFTVLPGPSSWESHEQIEEYFSQLRERLGTVPGIEEVATVHAVPVVVGGWVMGTWPVDDPPPEGEMAPLARWRPVSHEYFSTAGVRLAAGRGFTDRDLASTEPVTVLNRTTARQFFGSAEQALGQEIQIGFEGDQRLRVVGVIEDVRILGLREEAPLAAYRPYPQSSPRLHGIQFYHRSMLLRSLLPAEGLDSTLRAAVQEVDPMANVLNLESMETSIATSLAEPRMVMLLLAAFAAIALLLGAIGLYGVMGYAVGERTREMGIRLALGASVPSILRLVLASGLGLAATGLALGAVLALGLSHLLANQVFEVSPSDPATFILAATVLLAAALLATLQPARRAGRVDPVETLRSE